MAAFVSDSFEGISGEDIQVYNPAWARITGITGSTTIGARMSARGTGAFYRNDAIPPSPDYSVLGEIYITSANSGPNLAVLGRVSATAATYYQANLISGTGIRLARTINGSSVTIETAPYTVVAGNSLRIKLVMEGGSISVYADDALIIGPVTDTLIAGPGHVGFRIINAGSGQLQLDSISGETLGAPANKVFDYAANGGIAILGAAPAARSTQRGAVGGLVLAGQAQRSRTAARAAVGGIQLSGSAGRSRMRAATGAGGLLLSGAASIVTNASTQLREVVAAGGIAFIGAARRITTAIRSGAGGITLSGRAGYTNSGVIARGAAILRRRTRPRQPVSRR